MPSDFTFDNGAVPNTKTDLNPVPGGLENKYLSAAEVNQLVANEVSLRTALLAGRYHGLAPQSSAPVTNPAAAQWYYDTAGNLNMVRPDGTVQCFSVLALGNMGASYTPDFAKAQYHFGTLNADHTFNNPSNGPAARAGTLIYVYAQQDGTGYHALSFGNQYLGVTGAYMARQGPNQLSRFTFLAKGNGTYRLVGSDAIDLGRQLTPMDWGAAGDAVTDDTTAVQACNTFAKASTPPRPILLNQKFLVTSPVVADVTGYKMTGLNRVGTGLVHNSTYCGPTILVAPNSGWAQLPTRTALATGPGVAMDLDGTGHYFLNFCDDPQFKMDGLATFCVEFFLKLDTDPSGTSNIFSYQGRSWPFADGLKKTFQIYANAATVYSGPAGKWSPTITCTIGGATKNIIPGFTPLFMDTGTTYHCALTYDGTTLRFWAGVPGGTAVLQGSIAATGTLTSGDRQDCTVGNSVNDWPESTTEANMVDGAIDSIRISNTARYTSAYTAPTAKLASDANTLMLHNFDNEQRYFSVAKSGVNGLPFYIPTRRTDNGGGLISDVSLSDFLLQNNYPTKGGVQVYACTNFRAEHVTVTSCTSGIRLDNNCFKSYVKDCVVAAGTGSGTGARAGILTGNACGVTTIERCLVTGFIYGVVGCNGVGVKYDHVDFEPSAASLYSLVLLNSDATMDGADASATVTNIYIDDESAPSTFIAGAVVQQMNSVVFTGCNFDLSTPGHTSAAVVVDGGRSYSFDGTAFAANAGLTPVFTFLADPQNSIKLAGCQRFRNAAPWATAAKLSLIDEDGAQRKSVADADYTAKKYDRHIGYATLTGAHAVTLPDASTVPNGWRLTVKDEAGTAGSHTLTLTPAAGTIDGAGSKTITTNYGALRLYSDGANWFTE